MMSELTPEQYKSKMEWLVRIKELVHIETMMRSAGTYPVTLGMWYE